MQRQPENMPDLDKPMLCSLRTESGVHTSIVLAVPPQVAEHDALLEYAIRHTLVADSLSLQFRLPPPNVKLPQAHSDPRLAFSASLVDTLAVTSLWAVHVLRQLSKRSTYRSLVGLGIAAIGNSPVQAFTQADALRFRTAVQGMENASVDVV